MIVYDLKCPCGGQFEGWFKNRADFEQQNADGRVICPFCGSGEIRKILSPVALCASPSPSPQESGGPHFLEQADATPENTLRLLRQVQDFVEKNFDDVGAKLAEESLKIHYGVCEPHNIRGSATAAEEKMLKKEGIELLKIPMVKKPSNPKLH